MNFKENDIKESYWEVVYVTPDHGLHANEFTTFEDAISFWIRVTTLELEGPHGLMTAVELRHVNVIKMPM